MANHNLNCLVVLERAARYRWSSKALGFQPPDGFFLTLD
jgi:hypothetical protein